MLFKCLYNVGIISQTFKIFQTNKFRCLSLEIWRLSGILSMCDKSWYRKYAGPFCLQGPGLFSICPGLHQMLLSCREFVVNLLFLFPSEGLNRYLYFPTSTPRWSSWCSIFTSFQTNLMTQNQLHVGFSWSFYDPQLHITLLRSMQRKDIYADLWRSRILALGIYLYLTHTSFFSHMGHTEANWWLLWRMHARTTPGTKKYYGNSRDCLPVAHDYRSFVPAGKSNQYVIITVWRCLAAAVNITWPLM